MTSVGLITYHAAHNNGSFLQAYATQKKIRQLGVQCDVIDFSTPLQQYIYAVYKPIRGPKDIVKNAYALLHHRLIQQRHDDFEHLIHSALSLTPHSYSDPSQMRGLEHEYDIFVSGSDQIWNMDAWDYSDAYFLNFVHNKPKVSYASSMGGHILDKRGDKQLAVKYRALLADYRAISVRERSAQDYLNDVIDQPVTQVIDPTLLLKQHDYDDITAPRLVNEPYIFYYAIDSIERNDSAARAVQEYAASKGLPVYVMFTGNKSFGLKKYGFHLLEAAAPNHYLSLIKHADHVLTASFHGTAFSILFEKQFHVVRGMHNGKVNMDDRMSSLLHVCGLESQQLIQGHPWQNDVIDYDAVKPRLQREVDRSTVYLQQALQIR
ncbi:MULTISPECIES: polysaccharide pyruvyl transferase family protein [unclassified Bifidobacterium]|uniref:polysaccharide pyruvyl transferase family protein n=1 Tax=unclassified Bifidobacterium TaxID=2608897 RepID=UPI00112A3A78|nr:MULTISPECIES: polysaccharide pyruvyl transferase family protein [unclassified Bifidobacterium]TPF78574.1 polysaccharide pyruvyl transferase [Bifidobacterium sp. UTCIF-1]TPF80855.1 polysaccharide pyruvyl transferase [Bifidobacterium sp. UTCIF-24]TPF82706.1 polysaccharide pyruvyl transferase [Bifidobacterium sp. UTCIF-3]TPF84520.1 polysaccharide pyruvyl transferase [Bifidobacterium sp. UTCIF-36]TPF90919.1 polysaccharide pyruvyl transferase [Bifidobacterium sp. UTBIF-56]